jgi:hypothetical protein
MKNNMRTKRNILAERRKRKKLISTTLFGIGGIAIFSVLGLVLWNTFRPAIGESIPIMDDFSHVPVGTNPGPFNSDPPTSGPHFPGTLPPGFYHEADLAQLPEHPAGFLIHNLEHGYVIFWYNCTIITDAECTELKANIQSVMDAYNGVKLIAFPWESIEYPLVMTSWGRLMEFEAFDRSLARQFVERNRYKAPEPQGA